MLVHLKPIPDVEYLPFDDGNKASFSDADQVYLYKGSYSKL